MVFFRFFFFVSLSIFVLESAHALKGPKLPCSMRNSNYCKDPKYFKKDLKDGCASIRGNCRKKFCNANCFDSTNIPEKEGEVYRLCQLHCDPQEITHLSRKERILFQTRFEDKKTKRKHEVMRYVDNLLSRLPWCEGECDYDETSPNSCKTNRVKSADHWSVCAQNCYFIKDIKDHAEKCAQKRQGPPVKPRPKKES
ncbi:MAG: hypothetical protein ACK5PQ_00405 [Alphaproteobacteria bacterium]